VKEKKRDEVEDEEEGDGRGLPENFFRRGAGAGRIDATALAWSSSASFASLTVTSERGRPGRFVFPKFVRIPAEIISTAMGASE
jgi:hypothetical protein